MIRVLLADDHAAVRAGLYALLRVEPGFVPVATAADGRAALDEARRHTPDVALLDYHLPGGDGLDLCRALRRAPDPPQVIIYTAFAHETLALAGSLVGAHSVVSKGAPVDELFDALRRAARSEPPPPVAPELLAGAGELVALEDLPILGMLADQTPPGEIARVLGLERGEVEQRVAQIVAQLKQAVDGKLAAAR